MLVAVLAFAPLDVFVVHALGNDQRAQPVGDDRPAIRPGLVAFGLDDDRPLTTPTLGLIRQCWVSGVCSNSVEIGVVASPGVSREGAKNAKVLIGANHCDLFQAMTDRPQSLLVGYWLAPADHFSTAARTLTVAAQQASVHPSDDGGCEYLLRNVPEPVLFT